MRPRARVDRWTGAILIACALAYAQLARGYVVTFVADPLGPRAAPFLLAALLTAIGAWLVARPAPDGEGPGHPPSSRTVPAIGVLAGYGLALPWLGFVLATGLLFAALARLAEGPPLRALGLGGAFATALYYLFVFALDVPLPIGRLFPFLGG